MERNGEGKGKGKGREKEGKLGKKHALKDRVDPKIGLEHRRK